MDHLINGLLLQAYYLREGRNKGKGGKGDQNINII